MKKILMIVLAVLVVTGVVLAALPKFISSDFVKQQLTQQIQAATGRNISISGDISLRFLPLPWAQVGGVTLSNPAGWGNEPFMQVGALSVKLDIAPLLAGKVVMSSVEIDKPVIHLAVNAQGKNNWTFGAPQPQEKQENGAQQTNNANAGDLPIRGLAIREGQISYSNAADKSEWKADKLDVSAHLGTSAKLKGSTVWNGKPVEIHADVESVLALLANGDSKAIASIKTESLTVDMNGTVKSGVFTGALKANSPSLKTFGNWIKPGSVATAAPLETTLQGNLQCGAVQCNLTGAQFAIDKIKGNGDVRSAFGRGTPQIQAALNIEVLDLTPFLPKETASDSLSFIGNAMAASQAGWSNAPLALPSFDALNLNATIKFGGILYRAIKVGFTTLTLRTEQGNLRMSVSDSQLYGGNANGQMSLISAGVPLVESRWAINGIDIGALLKDAGITDSFTGKSAGQISLTTRGGSEKEMVSNLMGNGNFKVSNGVIKGISLFDMLQNVKSAFAPSTAGQTNFTSLDGTFKIIHGIVNNDDLRIATSNIGILGKGQVDLPQRMVNYRLTPVLGSADRSKQGLVVDVIVQGPFDNLSYRPDLSAAINDAIKNPAALKEQLKNSKGAVQDLIKGFR